ncbi:MAG TPA: bifunctional phosphoribosylaminoimidazolecarboxamide formyltransferase/inosine monophosphate cyclohydrolase [Blastocatellia bacterium]|nr:bifunctional phosphoribosylaminoimidazolecarboxamide formyltransferase/inosine monophosphate cyclohydrolase [Blastocatellia bacterium]
MRKIRRALISVSDKMGIVDFARELKNFGVEIISTGGTAMALRDAGLEVRDVSDVTGFPEMMDGRVKTLHPKIHGALLGRRDNPEHQKAMGEHGIEPIDLVVVNLYPFEQTIKRKEVTLEEAIEQIDIGGPAMIRSAAKNYHDVAVIVLPAQYTRVIDELNKHDGAVSLDTRNSLAREAFGQTSRYDMIVCAYLAGAFSRKENEAEGMGGSIGGMDLAGSDGIGASVPATNIDSEEFSIETFRGSLPSRAEWTISKAANLRYGENPHQIAALYKTAVRSGIANAELLSGKEMSFNNYVDADAAWQLVCDFDELACAIIKHTNPTGVALGASAEEAYRRALATDPTSAFGGIVAFNRTVDAAAARAVVEIFTEVIVAPDYDAPALEVLRAKKNLRVLRAGTPESATGLEYKHISGGMLVQTRDTHKLKREDLKVVTKRDPTEDEIRDLLFAWTVCKHTKSNAIVYAREGQTVGVGAGQMSRVDSVKLGAMRAQLPVKNSVLASDAFFPFRDGIDEAAKNGITAVIQPGGSMRDAEVIAACDEHGVAMVFTGTRHFKH